MTKINSLNGARTIAMLCIFLFHSGFIPNGIFPVTFFFILSGFVMYYSLIFKVKNKSLFDSFIFGISKIKTMYYIYFATFIISLLIRQDWLRTLSISEFIISSFRNLTLTQTLTPIYSLSYNNLSWYMATLFICYLFSEYLVYFIKNLKILTMNIILLTLGAQLFIVLIVPYIIEDYLWFLYMSPYYRIMDFILGMLISKYYLEKRDDNHYPRKHYICGEVCFISLFFIAYCLSFKLPLQFTRGIIYTPVFLVGIYFIAHEKGILKLILSHRLLQELAKYSFEFYMIHELILILFRKIFISLEFPYIIKLFFISLPTFFISLILSILCNTINKAIINYKVKIKISMLKEF
ncbi:acyltransferase [Turicibacter sanguinis]|uniref:acyltransferase family protein n=1 Tax=Turicibacter sanguinis TaxID=154288 RepID=UPI002330813F|nr:acyltransferase [Turicibacter sanguinis]MDB8540868.1 acyltransferase [Turicibacter sanguinis]